MSLRSDRHRPSLSEILLQRADVTELQCVTWPALPDEHAWAFYTQHHFINTLLSPIELNETDGFFSPQEGINPYNPNYTTIS